MYAVRLTIPDGPDLNAALLPNLAAAVAQLAAFAEARWQQYAQGAPLPNGGRVVPRSGAYLASIKRAQISDYAWEIASDAPYADAIERGTGPRDLKRMLDSSMKVRRTKDGRRYLIIPFRWGTGTGSGGGVSFGKQVMPMPPHVHAAAKALSPSRITGHGWRPSGTGAWSVRTHGPAMVRQRRFAWGGRLSAAAIRGAAPGLDERHVRRMAGMVKMQHPTRRGSRDTQYMTFRVMIEGGKGWLAPARAGLYPARAVAEELERKAPDILQRALAQDLQAATL